MARESKVALVLTEHMNRVNTAADLILDSTNDWQLIKNYLANRVTDLKLNTNQKEKMLRYQFIYNQLATGRFTDKEVLEANMKQHDVGQAQSYDDLRCTREIFSSVININKKFELDLQLQVNRRMLRKAEELCDFKAYAALEKNRTQMLAMVEDIDPNDAEMFEGHTYKPVFDPSLIDADPVDMKEVLKSINDGRKVKIKTELFENLDYEEA